MRANSSAVSPIVALTPAERFAMSFNTKAESILVLFNTFWASTVPNTALVNSTCSLPCRSWILVTLAASLALKPNDLTKRACPLTRSAPNTPNSLVKSTEVPNSAFISSKAVIISF